MVTLIPLSNYTAQPWDLVATRYFYGNNTSVRWRTEITWANLGNSFLHFPPTKTPDHRSLVSPPSFIPLPSLALPLLFPFIPIHSFPSSFLSFLCLPSLALPLLFPSFLFALRSSFLSFLGLPFLFFRSSFLHTFSLLFPLLPFPSFTLSSFSSASHSYIPLRSLFLFYYPFLLSLPSLALSLLSFPSLCYLSAIFLSYL